MTPSSWPGTGSPSYDTRGLELLRRRLRLLRGEVGGGAADDQVAPGGQLGQQPLDQVVRAVLVGDEVQQCDQGEGDRPVEVQHLPGARDDRVRAAHVGLQILGPPLGCAVQQGRHVGRHDGVVVAVDDGRVGGDPLGDLVEVRLGGYARGARDSICRPIASSTGQFMTNSMRFCSSK